MGTSEIKNKKTWVAYKNSGFCLSQKYHNSKGCRHAFSWPESHKKWCLFNNKKPDKWNRA